MEYSKGFEQLLLNSGLKASINGDVIIVKKAPIEGSALELSTMTIRGQGMGEIAEDSGSYTTGLVSVGSKTPTALKEHPANSVYHQSADDRGSAHHDFA